MAAALKSPGRRSQDAGAAQPEIGVSQVEDLPHVTEPRVLAQIAGPGPPGAPEMGEGGPRDPIAANGTGSAFFLPLH